MAAAAWSSKHLTILPLGRPKIDRMTFKTVEDTNTNLAAVLAGEVDFCMRSTISFDGAVILREQWEKQGKGKVLTSPASWTWLNLSRDNPLFSDVRVRRALLHAIDRDAMAQNIFKGERIVSHVPLSRVRKSYKKALATASIYKYDAERAKKLLAEAGWKPGSDGVMANGKGERLEFEFRCTAERRDHEQAQAIIADYWKRIGVRTNIKNMPNRLLNSAENRSRWPGAFIGSHNVTVEEWQERFHSKNIPAAENKYSLGKRFRLERPEKGRDLGRTQLHHYAGPLRTTADRVLQDVQRGAAALAVVFFAGSAGREKRLDGHHTAPGKRRAELEQLEHAPVG